MREQQYISTYGGIKVEKKRSLLSLVVIYVLISVIFNSCFFCSAESVLEISGPADAFEGEEIEFTVTLNGEPVQARVTFGDILPADYSNSNTGKISFITPSVAYDDKEYLVTASLLGELFVSHKILVKNRTGILGIDVFPDFVRENEEFIVTIKERDEPVANASVWFHSSVYKTNESGKVTLLAPDVLITTNYRITVNKTGYKSSSSMITIHNNHSGKKLMEVIYPSIVEPGLEGVEIRVISNTLDLEDVTINLIYESQNYGAYTTDETGIAYIDIPLINNENFFSFSVAKEDYHTYYSTEEFIVFLFERDFPMDLELNLVNSEVDEGKHITVQISDEVGGEIEGASIWRGSIELDELTDVEGILTFLAPSVFMDREYYLYAIKEGYNYAVATITIRDTSNNQEEMNIESQNIVNETDIFSVCIKDDDNILVPNVAVTFNSEQKVTNESGIVLFSAPNVPSTKFFEIKASKFGYLPAYSSIEVVNIGDSNGVSNNKLKICVEPSIRENEAFLVTVRDDQENVLSGVGVTFKDTTLYTDYKGEVIFSAPDVGWDEKYEICATKSGYTSFSTQVTIKNIEGFQYWYLIFVIIIILIIGVVAYFRYGRLY